VSNDSDEEIPKLWFELREAIAERNFLRKNLPLIAPHEPLEPPYNFHGRFEIDDYRTGGMGMVLFGWDTKLKRKVALKLLQSSGDEADAKLMAEARALAKLSQPNVVTIYDVCDWEGGMFLVMEFVDGRNGQEWLEHRPPWQEVLGVFIDAGQGLAAAHQEKIQHGDFKPANILIGKDGRTRVADFGVANYCSVDDDEGEPTGRRSGTLEYMAPERLRGRDGDARSDQFSFCASLWRGLHGSRPFPGKTVLRLLEAIEAGTIDPRLLDPRVPGWLNAVVRKGLADDPDQRYPSMQELLKALRDEPPASDTTDDELDDDDGPIEVDRGVLHTPDEREPAGVFVTGWTNKRDEPEPDTAHDGEVSDRESAEEDGRSVNDGAIKLAGPVVHGPVRGAGGFWGYVATAVLSVLAVRGVEILTSSPAPEPATGVEMLTRSPALEPATEGIQAEASTVILGLISEDKFTEAQQMWSDHASELTDEQSLQIARNWMTRAREHAPDDRTKAKQTASAALEVADHVGHHGSTAVTKKVGIQLAAEAKIYEQIAADQFVEAGQTWLNHEAELTDDQALQLAEDCLDRARQLADVARDQARAAARTTIEIAASKEKGGQLVADATAFHEGHPPAE
jgi:serine/threonine protein kinase